MAGRHRRPPAWRRLLLRLRRTDRAARFAALQAEVIALRSTVAELHLELATAQAERGMARAAAAAAAVAAAASSVPAQSPRGIRWVGLDLPMVSAGQTGQTGQTEAGEKTIEIDLRDVIARADVVLSSLPEAELLDPKRDRAVEVADPASDSAAVAERSAAQRQRRSA